jgi:single-stranded-DNA-specific exonuclease
LLSFTGKNWSFPDKDNDDLVKEIVAICEVPEISARIMVNRGITNHDYVKRFLNAKVRDLMPAPLLLLDMKEAVDRIYMALSNNEKIFVFGDYDVDGIVSVYLVVDYLKKLGCDDIVYYLPNRFSDGYGLNNKLIEKMLSTDATLLIVVDSGTNSIDAINKATSRGLDCIIVDHHTQLEESLPRAVAVINPNRNDQEELGESSIKNLCAAGVVYMLLIALQKHLKEKKFFEGSSINKPELLDYVGIVAIGTLCDVMKVIGLNRAYINLAMKTQKFPRGIEALMKASNIEKISSPDDFSFTIGPAINAAGRLHDPSIVIDMLLSDDDCRTARLAEQLVELNNTRKKIEREILEEAIVIINNTDLHNDNAIFVYGEGWHGGVIGIIAGRLKDRFSKPVFVATFNSDNGIGTGSARSPENYTSIAHILSEAVSEGILISGGGHSMAGGFSLSLENAPAFRNFLNSRFKAEREVILNIDCLVPKSIDLKKLRSCVTILEPYGKGVEQPVFCMKDLSLLSMRYTQSQDHMIICFKGEWNSSIRAALFNVGSKNEIVRLINQNSEKRFDLAFFIKSSEKYGVGIIVEDIRLSD